MTGRELLDFIQGFAFLILVVQVLRSPEPLSFKLAVVGVPIIVAYTYAVYRFGRRHGSRDVDRLD
jgi:hypothetical protein